MFRHHKVREILFSLFGPIWKAYPTQKSGDIVISPRPHLESLSNTKVGRHSYLSSVAFGKHTHHKCREIFVPLLSPILKAYPTQKSGDIVISPRPHLESLSNTNVGRHSYLSSGRISENLPITNVGDIRASPRSHRESLPSTCVTLTCYVIKWHIIYKLYKLSNRRLRQSCRSTM